MITLEGLRDFDPNAPDNGQSNNPTYAYAYTPSIHSERGPSPVPSIGVRATPSPSPFPPEPEPEAEATSPTRSRRVPSHVPEDIDEASERDFLLEHLNDPNFDLKAYIEAGKQTPPPMYSGKNGSDRDSLEGVEDLKSGKGYKYEYKYRGSDTESAYDSERYYSERPGSRNSTAVEFDEYVFFVIIVSSNA
jgi:hypothetical protein